MKQASKVRHILQNNLYCTLATVCDDGTPWGTPVFFGFDNQHSIFWRSWVESVHSKNVAARKRAFITIFDSQVTWGTGVGVYMSGEVRQINERAEVEEALITMNPRSLKLSTAQEFLPPSPRRMYQFTPQETWLNSGKEKDGQMVDIRIEVKI